MPVGIRAGFDASAARGRRRRASITKSAPAPPSSPPESRPPDHSRSFGLLVISRTFATSSSPSTLGSSTCVAPTFNASSRRARIGSIAMIVDAPGDARALHGAEPERTAADDGHGRARARRSPVPATWSAPRPATATQLQTMPRSTARRLREDRHDPFLERHHHLGEPADVRVGVDRRAVAHVGHRHEIVGALAAEELAHVGCGRAGTGSRCRTAACPTRTRGRPPARAARRARRPRRRRRRRGPG